MVTGTHTTQRVSSWQSVWWGWRRIHTAALTRSRLHTPFKCVESMYHCQGFHTWLYVLPVPAGYGFVDFDSPASAQKAVTALKAGGVQAQMAKVRTLCVSCIFNKDSSRWSQVRSYCCSYVVFRRRAWPGFIWSWSSGQWPMSGWRFESQLWMSMCLIVLGLNRKSSPSGHEGAERAYKHTVYVYMYVCMINC